MIRTYVINLDRSTDRLAQIDTQFARLGVRYTRVPAVDTATVRNFMSERGYRPGVFKAQRRQLFDAQLACMCSHVKALEAMIADGCDHALIVEDDIVLHADVVKLLHHPMASLPSFDILKLEGSNRTNREKTFILGEFLGRHVVCAASPTLGSAGYIVSRPAAKRLLKILRVIDTPADHFLFHYWRTGIKTLEMRPLMAIQTGVDSLIEPHVLYEKHPGGKVRLQRRIIRLHRRLRIFKLFGFAARRSKRELPLHTPDMIAVSVRASAVESWRGRDARGEKRAG